MSHFRSPFFVGFVVAFAVCNEFVLAFLFAHTGELRGAALWIIRALDALFVIGAALSPRYSATVLSWVGARFRRAPNFSATILGASLVAILLIAIELGFYAHLVIDERRSPSPTIVRDLPLSHYMDPGVTGREQRVDGDRVIYDFTYTLDQKSARITPASPSTATGQDLVFFGCSFTFGVGVSDSETLPNAVARRAPGWRVTNFGVGGYGPAHMLQRIGRPETTEFFRGNETHVVYVYIPHHVRRVIGSMRTATRFGRHFPYYTMGAEGELNYRGTMSADRSLLQPLYEVLDHEAVMKFFNIDLPVFVTEKHLELTAAIIAESRERWVEMLGESNFTVVIYPEPLWAETPAEQIIPSLESRGIRCLDYSDRFEGQPQMWIPEDKHPTGAAHDRVAQWIAEDLDLGSGKATTD